MMLVVEAASGTRHGGLVRVREEEYGLRASPSQSLRNVLAGEAARLKLNRSSKFLCFHRDNLVLKNTFEPS